MTKLLIFSIITTLIIIILLYLINRFIKEKSKKDLILKLSALLTVILHYSSLWVSYFTTGKAVIDNTMLLPIYPCNICMWMLLIVSFMKNKESKVYIVLTEFLALGGTICGAIGLYANEIFLANPTFSDYFVLKGLLSHSTMLFGTLMLLTSGYIKIRTFSMTISSAIGLGIFAIIGAIVNTLFEAFELGEVNAMFMLDFPLDIPGANFMTLGILGIIVAFILSTLYEVIFLPEHERWYVKIKKNKEV